MHGLKRDELNIFQAGFRQVHKFILEGKGRSAKECHPFTLAGSHNCPQPLHHGLLASLPSVVKHWGNGQLVHSIMSKVIFLGISLAYFWFVSHAIHFTWLSYWSFSIVSSGWEQTFMNLYSFVTTRTQSSCVSEQSYLMLQNSRESCKEGFPYAFLFGTIYEHYVFQSVFFSCRNGVVKEHFPHSIADPNRWANRAGSIFFYIVWPIKLDRPKIISCSL